ncbi:MAG: hypothetical protein F4139_07680 [Gemmatimonadetes bacterium]|nr:hypothetical protein [Gemmatimonadota bacterium]MYA63136.1 hypothetical protein [Gemmatimonadota bacterium]MYB98836.1 hypothetical protein [Gemmatimonadota bacterium]MYH52816.1 hypothetical protein [Gemmatimonadota bacterium]MYK66863.1 hypothetical protein [Gemmatimonadota bacterium]
MQEGQEERRLPPDDATWQPVATFHYPAQAWDYRAPLRGLYRIIWNAERRTFAAFRDAGSGVPERLGEHANMSEVLDAVQKDANRSAVLIPRSFAPGEGPFPKVTRFRVEGVPVAIIERPPTLPSFRVAVADSPDAAFTETDWSGCDHVDLLRLGPGRWTAREDGDDQRRDGLPSLINGEGETWKDALRAWIADRDAMRREATATLADQIGADAYA